VSSVTFHRDFLFRKVHRIAIIKICCSLQIRSWVVVLLVYFSILFVALQVREREKKSSFMQAFMEKRAEKEAGGKLQIEGKHSGHS
jgi:F0F1-type ATP synthase membrane subunit a